MTIYRVSFNTFDENDKKCELFFKTFEGALKFVRSNIPAIDYMHGEYYIGGSSAYVYEENYSLHIRNAEFQHNAQYYCNIDPYKLPFELTSDSFWILYFMKGYVSRIIYGDDPKTELIGEFPSEEDAEAYAESNEKLKHIARQWRAEDASRIDSMGHGEDYLTIRRIHVN